MKMIKKKNTHKIELARVHVKASPVKFIKIRTIKKYIETRRENCDQKVHFKNYQ